MVVQIEKTIGVAGRSTIEVVVGFQEGELYPIVKKEEESQWELVVKLYKREVEQYQWCGLEGRGLKTTYYKKLQPCFLEKHILGSESCSFPLLGQGKDSQ